MAAGDPVPPENVRLVRPDGTEVPVECRYGGVDSAGIHQWVAVAPVGVVMTPGMAMRVGMFPALTSVAVGFEP